MVKNKRGRTFMIFEKYILNRQRGSQVQVIWYCVQDNQCACARVGAFLVNFIILKVLAVGSIFLSRLQLEQSLIYRNERQTSMLQVTLKSLYCHARPITDDSQTEQFRVGWYKQGRSTLVCTRGVTAPRAPAQPRV